MSKHILNFNQWMELKENRRIEGNLLNENEGIDNIQNLKEENELTKILTDKIFEGKYRIYVPLKFENVENDKKLHIVISKHPYDIGDNYVPKNSLFYFLTDVKDLKIKNPYFSGTIELNYLEGKLVIEDLKVVEFSDTFFIDSDKLEKYKSIVNNTLFEFFLRYSNM